MLRLGDREEERERGEAGPLGTGQGCAVQRKQVEGVKAAPATPHPPTGGMSAQLFEEGAQGKAFRDSGEEAGGIPAGSQRCRRSGGG